MAMVYRGLDGAEEEQGALPRQRRDRHSQAPGDRGAEQPVDCEAPAGPYRGRSADAVHYRWGAIFELVVHCGDEGCGGDVIDGALLRTAR
jgi:hypothetical protein